MGDGETATGLEVTVNTSTGGRPDNYAVTIAIAKA